MLALNGLEFRHIRGATGIGQRAALAERTTLGHAGHVGRCAGDGDQVQVVRVHARNRIEQTQCVGVRCALEDVLGIALLHHAAAV
jgi:hypothetical protein